MMFFVRVLVTLSSYQFKRERRLCEVVRITSTSSYSQSIESSESVVFISSFVLIFALFENDILTVLCSTA